MFLSFLRITNATFFAVIRNIPAKTKYHNESFRDGIQQASRPATCGQQG